MRKLINEGKIFYIIPILISALFALAFFKIAYTKYDFSLIERNTSTILLPDLSLKSFNKPLSHPPSEIKALYTTAYFLSSEGRRTYLLKLLKKQNFNALVVTLKDYSGHIFWPSEVKLAKDLGAYKDLGIDLSQLVAFFHKNNIYLIARLVVFQDNLLASKRPDLAIKTISGKVWKDKGKFAWVDPASKEVWDYIVDLSSELIRNYGFDELNFDYVRFPSQENGSKLIYPIFSSSLGKDKTIKGFFVYLLSSLRNRKIKLSVDLFGQTTVNNFDFGIGQILEDAANFDFICPMVYPSHFRPGNFGFKNPANHPYKVVYLSLKEARDRLKKINSKAKLRPWLQAFSLRTTYTLEMVKAQIKAVKDLGLKAGFMLWDPSSWYKVLY